MFFDRARPNVRVARAAVWVACVALFASGCEQRDRRSVDTGSVADGSSDAEPIGDASDSDPPESDGARPPADVGGGDAGDAGPADTAASDGDTDTSTPGCVPETDEEFCADLSKDCEIVSGFDSCGVGRTANCGTCTPPETCGGDGVPNVCGLCAAETDEELCARGSFDCGILDVTDRCGVRRFPSCGMCPTGRCIVSSACSANRCTTVESPDGTSCGDGDVTDRRSCRAGACVRPVAYCDRVAGGWAYQSDRLGAWYYDADCSCPTSTLLRYVPLSVMGHPTQEAMCSSCVAVGSRRVCF